MGRISHYMITRDAKPVRVARRMSFAPYGIMGEVLVDLKKGEDPTLFVVPDGLEKKDRENLRRSQLRSAKRLVKNTRAVALKLEDSIHYDWERAKAIGTYDSKQDRDWETQTK